MSARHKRAQCRKASRVFPLARAHALIMVRAMSDRTRKFFGVTAMVAFTVFYLWLAVSVAIVRLPGAALGLQLAFYFIVAAIWFAVCAAIIWWMRPRNAQQTEKASGS